MDLPDWFISFTNQIVLENRGSVVDVKEWKNEEKRSEDGFEGFDFCHSIGSPVRILQYLLINKDSEDKEILPRLVAPVKFTNRAESGRGYCHGGSMCAVMDDAIGWMGFCCTGEVKPWFGFTVQVDTSLRKPIPVGSLLRLEAWIDRFEGERKVWITCRLHDPIDPELIYSEGKGLFLKAKQ